VTRNHDRGALIQPPSLQGERPGVVDIPGAGASSIAGSSGASYWEPPTLVSVADANHACW